MPSPSDFGINLNSSNYTNSTVNPFAAVSNPDNVPANRNFLWCTEFAFGRAAEKGLINAKSGLGAKIRGHAGKWDDQAGSWSSQPRANRNLRRPPRHAEKQRGGSDALAAGAA